LSSLEMSNDMFVLFCHHCGANKKTSSLLSLCCSKIEVDFLAEEGDCCLDSNNDILQGRRGFKLIGKGRPTHIFF